MRLILQHRLAVVAVFTLFVIAGLIAWPSLPVELLPSLKYPRLVIVTSFGNASAEEVESLLTRPVEEAVGTVSGLRSMNSVSSEGTSSVVLRFNWGSNMSLAAAEVREKLDLVADQFPREAKLPIVFQYDPSDAPIVTLALTGAGDLRELHTNAKTVLKPDLETTGGVAAVRLSGGLVPEIQVLVNVGRLSAQSVDLKLVADRLENANINFPGGTLIKGTTELPVRTVGRFRSLDEIGRVSLGWGSQASSIQIKDVAGIEQSHADRTSVSRVNGRPAVLLGIVKEPTENTVEVSQRILTKLEELRRKVPKGAKLEVVDDEAPFVKQALKDLRTDMLWGSFLAFGVLLIFLRSLRSSVLILISIPVSVISTFALMSFFGVTLNIMSIGGMALGVGMLLDCSIVVLEAVHRKYVQVGDIFEATLSAVVEVGPSVISGTLTTMAVLVPILFMTGLAQRLFRDFAFTMGASVMMSLLVSIFLLPAIVVASRSAQRLPSVVTAKVSPFDIAYRSALSRTLDKPRFFLGACLVLIVGAAIGLYRLGFELLPKIDLGQFSINLTLPADSSLETVERTIDKAEASVRDLPRVKSFVTEAGSERGGKLEPVQQTRKQNEASISVQLEPESFGSYSTDAAIQKLRELTKGLQGVHVDFVFKQGPLARILGITGSPELLRVSGDDLATLRVLVDKVSANLKGSSALKDISCEGSIWTEHRRVLVDRYKAASAGVSVEEVANAVRWAIEGRSIGKYMTEDQDQDIRVRLSTKDSTTVEDLRKLPIRNGAHDITLLGNIAEVQPGTGPREIVRHDRRRTLVFHGNVAGKAVSQGQDEALRAARSTNLPEGYDVQSGAERFELMESVASLSTAVALAAMLVYAILVIQFESLLWPLVVFTALPLTIVGPAIALTASGSPVSVLVLIGAVVLVGIVVNMAILLVATINDLRRRGKDLRTAVVEGSAIRLRPILMTTLTTVFGALPVCLSQGGADQLNKPLALTLIAGLLASTVFKLFGIPVVYEIVGKTRFGRLSSANESQEIGTQ